jgi:hypothetical protein
MIPVPIGGLKNQSEENGWVRNPYYGRGGSGWRNGSIHKATYEFSETTLSASQRKILIVARTRR